MENLEGLGRPGCREHHRADAGLPEVVADQKATPVGPTFARRVEDATNIGALIVTYTILVVPYKKL